MEVVSGRMPRRTGAALALGLIFLTGCGLLPASPEMATVPRAWRQKNSWGPEGNAARAAGTLVPVQEPKRAAEWDAFAREHIQDGDLLFRLGTAYSPTQQITSRVLAGISDGPFSHDAFAHWEGDTLYIYDTVPAPEGVRRIPFAFWMLDVKDHSLAIKRLRPEFRQHIPAAFAFIQDAYLRQVPFDKDLSLDDGKLYCAEMIEKAFRSAGLVLSEPVPIRCLPHYRRYAFLRPLVERFSGIRVEEPVFAIGNDGYGTFGSPLLEGVYAGKVEPAHRQPTCPAVPY